MTENIVDIEEAVLEEKAILTGPIAPAQEAIDLPDCEIHDFVFLRSAKTKEKIKKAEQGAPSTLWVRIDTFYCQHCLRYTTMARQEPADRPPSWYRDDK